MPVRWEPATRRHRVIIDHAQAAEAHVLRIIIVAEGERVAAVEPVQLLSAACFRWTMHDGHGRYSSLGGWRLAKGTPRSSSRLPKCWQQCGFSEQCCCVSCDDGGPAQRSSR